MDKDAITDYPINEFAKRRWSPRAFLDKPVEKDKLLSLFEAARWSASGGNEQPWRFIVGLRPDETWQKIFSTLDEGNQLWNGHVPVLIITVGNKISSYDGTVSPFFQYDVGQSAAHLSIEAMSKGLHVHQMGGYSMEKARELFEIPENYQPLAAIAIGYLGDPESLPEKLKIREYQERKRKELREFIYSGKFGDTAPMILHP